MILSTLFSAIANILSIIVNVYTWIIIAAALVSWVKPDPSSPIVQLLYRLTDPVYSFIRRYIKTEFNGIDFAPLIVLLALQLIDQFLIRLLFVFAASL
ncbi:YggT family protein [Campylobacter concisus]|uniref:Integral membrane protein YggT, involved in response to extracytoplasmic stress (Osmotic shock) n=1 Tax=Campylobacter concisus UNSW2 TaxID=1242965 RepID=U2FMM0_9BACT|nr:YggT family protein [Campylobacter concisus]ERJ31660.1 Integral membrane protein YggT, involved in response to extracytoplasmic stress (osmotic shock) [Campylobacter concisus UNSW2]